MDDDNNNNNNNSTLFCLSLYRSDRTSNITTLNSCPLSWRLTTIVGCDCLRVETHSCILFIFPYSSLWCCLARTPTRVSTLGLLVLHPLITIIIMMRNRSRRNKPSSCDDVITMFGDHHHHHHRPCPEWSFTSVQ